MKGKYKINGAIGEKTCLWYTKRDAIRKYNSECKAKKAKPLTPCQQSLMELIAKGIKLYKEV